jgi:type VI protein secretion system component Hcp
MASSEMSDLFMYVVGDDGKPLDGESSMLVEKGDKFMTEFKSADYDSYSNFFDVTEFQFAMKLGDKDASTSSGSSGASAGTSLGISHADWYLLEDPVHKMSKDLYQLEKVAGSFGKVMDSVSPAFFQKCCEKATFKEMVLVKRALTTGATHDQESKAFGYLQIRMGKVRITSVAWTDGDFVEEKISFKCQHLKILYRPQKYSGVLDADKQLVDWTWSDRSKQKKSQSGQ